MRGYKILCSKTIQSFKTVIVFDFEQMAFKIMNETQIYFCIKQTYRNQNSFKVFRMFHVFIQLLLVDENLLADQYLCLYHSLAPTLSQIDFIALFLSTGVDRILGLQRSSGQLHPATFSLLYS